MQGWGGWQGASVVKPKIWTTDAFIAEYCDHIADDLLPQNDIVQLMGAFNDIVAKLSAMCDDPKNPTTASLYTQYDREREEEREKELAAAQAAAEKEAQKENQGAVTETNRGGVSISVGTRDGVVFSGSQYASWDNKDQKKDDQSAALKEKEAALKKLSQESTIDPEIRKKALAPLMKLRVALDRADGLYKKFDGFVRWRMQFYVSKMVPEIIQQIRRLKEEGDFVVLPVCLPSSGGIQVNMVCEYESKTTVRLTIMNPQPYTEYHPQAAQSKDPSKLKQLVSLTIPEVPICKITSEAWWSMVHLGALTLTNAQSESVFYTHFVTWLTDKTYEASIKYCVEQGEYSTPSKSVQTSYWKSLIHVLKYTLRRAGLSKQQVKILRHQVKKILLWEVEKDLSDVKAIKLATKKIIGAALQNTSLSIARNAPLMTEKTLSDSRQFIENLSNRLEYFTCDDDGITHPPPKLNVTEGWDRAQQCDSFPLTECFRRTSGIDQFAGAAVEQARLMPTNFLRIPAKVTDFNVALESIDECVALCTRLCATMNQVKNVGHLVYAAVSHLVIEVLPVPLGPRIRSAKNLRCIWSDTPMRYGQQVHLLKRLHELTEYFVFAVFTLQDPLHENEGLRAVVTGVLCAISDAVIRVQASDRASLFSVHYGGFYKNKPAFAILPGDFANVTQWLNFFSPEALVCRAQVLDYFAERRENVPESNIIWKWENGIQTYEDKPANALCRQLSHAEALMARGGLPWRMLGTNAEGPVSMLCRHFVEITYFRNITLYFHHQMCGDYVAKQDYLTTWSAPATFIAQGSAWKAHAFHGAQLRTNPRAAFDYLTAPRTYTRPEQVITEDDVLHVRNLPTFDDVLGQRDSELLLSYLTVPYIRIPLILRFLATEDRVSCLRSRQIQNLVTATLFEGGRFLTVENSGKVPLQVPAEDEKLIATPYGPLINELFHSTEGVLDPILRLLELACELDAGTVFNKTATDVILFLVRTVARILAFNSTAIGLATGEYKEHRFVEHRDIPTDAGVINTLSSARQRVFDAINEKIYPMLDNWVAEAMRTANEAKKTEEIDSATLTASTIFSHMILLHRTFKDGEWKNESVSRLLSCFTFLTTRHSWTGAHLPEIELYYIIHRQRRSIVKYLTLSTPDMMGDVLDAVVRIVTNTARRPGERVHPWALVAGPDCVGRFARMDEEVTKRAAAAKEKGLPELMVSLEASLGVKTLPSGVDTVAEGSQSVELNLQTLTLTFKAAHLVALPTEVAHDMNTIIVFVDQGLSLKMIEAMQCAIVEESTNRIWVRLVGQDHDIQMWRTPDARFPIPDDKMMRFYPDDIADTEKWVYEIFEPVRKSYFERNFWDPPIFVLLPEQKLTPEQSVATLQAVDSQSGRKLKEVVILRDFRCVHIYDVFSHGRRFYRSLVYSSDNRYCLRQLHPSIDRRVNPWLPWARHEAGNADPDASLEQNTSSCILRHTDHPDNISGSTEMYIPKELLHGLIPSCLGDTHSFWQDEDDNIRGYPLPAAMVNDGGSVKAIDASEGENEGENKAASGESTKKNAPASQHLLWLHWREMQFDALGFKNTGMRVTRFARAENAPKASEEAAIWSKNLKKEGNVSNEDEEKKEEDGASPAPADKAKKAKEEAGDVVDPKAVVKPPTDDNEYYEKSATREVGLYRESNVARSTAPAATIEDKDLLLLNLLYAREGTPLHSLALVLARIELLSHVLVWTTQTDYDSATASPVSLDLIQLPRLKLTFAAKLSADKRTYLIYSLDHSHLFISNLRQPLVTDLIQGIPHSLLLQDINGAISILVPALNLARPAIAKAPFSTELVINRSDTTWYTKLDTRYYLYPVHVSLSFMFTPTLASALYLLLLRFYNRNYPDVFRIASTIGTDMELTPEEYQIFNKLYFISDIHPNAHACRAKISLLVSDSPILLGWYTPREVALLVAKMTGVSVGCRLAAGEERRLLYLAVTLDEKMRIIREFLKKEDIKETAQLALARIASSDATKAIKLSNVPAAKSAQAPLTAQQQSSIRDLYTRLTTELREQMDVRVRRDDLVRLLTIFNNFAQEAMQPYLHHLLRNRRSIIEGEFKANAEGKDSIEIELTSPPIGKDLLWRFYRDYKPLETKLPGAGPKPINTDNRAMTVATRFDYYYCGAANVRKPQTCRCKGCTTNCFVADTPITLADGTVKRICDICVGDTVETFAFRTRDNKPSFVQPKVVSLYTSCEEKELVRVTFLDGRSIVCTPDHDFYKQNGHIVKAEDLHFTPAEQLEEMIRALTLGLSGLTKNEEARIFECKKNEMIRLRALEYNRQKKAHLRRLGNVDEAVQSEFHPDMEALAQFERNDAQLQRWTQEAAQEANCETTQRRLVEKLELAKEMLDSVRACSPVIGHRQGPKPLFASALASNIVSHASVEQVEEVVRISRRQRSDDDDVVAPSNIADAPSSASNLKDMMLFTEYLEFFSEGTEQTRPLPVVRVERLSEKEYVHCFTVDHHDHNFLANGVVVRNCGPQAGCPCPACEEWNRTQAESFLELMPNLEASKSAKQLSFFEAFQWIVDALQKWNNAKLNEEFPFMERTVPASLRDPENAFLRYYEIITGTTKIKVASGDCARDFADILFHFVREARNKRSPLGHLMHFVVATPEAWPKLPKWNRNSKERIDQRITNLYKGITSQAGLFQDRKPVDYTTFPKSGHKETYKLNLVPRKKTRAAGEPLEATTVLPIPANTSLRQFTVEIPDISHLRLMGDEANQLVVAPELLAQMASKPLAPVMQGDEKIVVFLNRKEQSLGDVPAKLPFDLSKHDHATKAVARSMIKRIEKDVADFAERENSASVPRIDGLSSVKEVMKLVVGAPTDAARKIISRLDAMLTRLTDLREKDIRFLAYAMPVVQRTANFVDVTGSDRQSTLIFLRRFAGKEALINIDFLFSLLCSDTHIHEARQLNPFLSDKQAHAIMQMSAVTVLVACRIAHANRTCELITDVLSLLGRATRQFPESLTGAVLESHKTALAMTIKQTCDSLAGQLITRRVYMSPHATAPNSYVLDPRFLVFEFTWNLIMRPRQAEMINEMYGAVTNSKALVVQSIMGGGKTTIISPLLSLMLSDGTNLVVLVVPPALLDFTRSVLRTTFSSVLQKQIFTFICDRSYDVDSDSIVKFEHAKTSRGIVVTTPSSLKSVFLKYVEALDKITDNSRKRTPDMIKEAADLSGVLKLWKEGTLLMDEVDLLLHPLKSELNFPIGAKQAIDFTPMRWKLPIHILDSIFYYHTKRLTTSLKESPEAFAVLQRFEVVIQEGLNTNALQEMPHLTLLNLDFYREKILPVMIDWVIMFLKAQHLRGLTHDETSRFLRCRPNKKDDKDKEFYEKITSLDPEHVQMLNLSFDWVNNFMPHIFQKINRVSFGIMNADDMRRARSEQPNMPASRFVTAIPFIGKDLPSQSSEFAHPDIVIGLTVLGYRYEGIRQSDFGEILGAVHASVEREVGRYSQRRSNIMYNKWVQSAGGKVVNSHHYKEKNKKSGETGAGAAAAASEGPIKDSNKDELGMQPSESMVFAESDMGVASGSYTAADEAAPHSPSRKGHRKREVAAAELEVLPLKLMRQANNEETQKLYKLLRRTGEVIHWYLCEDILPKFMRHQVAKLSASGQELGGNMIFQRRIGFSGTPSDLLPLELGSCEYERCTDGQLAYTLTNPEVMSFTIAPNGWTVRDLLDLIAKKASPHYNALIDTGALITGLSNHQVAKYLLKNGLAGMEGVVFLDEFDRKMILVRATGRVLKLAECGIPKNKRFAFYDQVHTTGMDIEHTPNAMAIQTLGKDMTFRDFSQGAYRMRGIGQGQTVQLLLIPEVYDLINRSLVSITGKAETDITKRSVEDVLQSVTAWLLVNSIRSEHIQHNQLCLQNCSNVWRKEAFRVLSERREEFKIEEESKLSLDAEHALDVFREPVTFDIKSSVPQPRMFSEAVASYVEAHLKMINSTDGKNLVEGIVAQTIREDEIENPTMDVELVQEQEEEREKEEEKEKEQEIEIEKFVDLDYTRDEETGSPWMLETLSDVVRAAHFYPMSDFRLYKRRPLGFPDSLLLSRNHFDSRWAGHRRLKNVCVTLDWIPSTNSLAVRESPAADYGNIDQTLAAAQLRRSLEAVAHHQGQITDDLVADILTTALHADKKNVIPEAEMAAVAQEILKQAKSASAATGGKIDPAALTDAVMTVFRSNRLRGEQSGRFTVALSLAEAETLRRVLHLDAQKGGGAIPGACAYALNVVPSNNVLLDASRAFVSAPDQYQAFRNYQCLRFFDGDLHYSETEFGLLLRALHCNQSKLRQAFFQQVISCRRRARQRWESTPIATLFKMENAFTLLQQRMVGLLVRREIDAKELNFGDAFISFNSSHSGQLSSDELWGALRWCRLSDLNADDVLNFLDVADTHHEGQVNYSDFVAVLTGKRDEEDDTAAPSDQDAQGKKLPTVPPYGAEELASVKADREKATRAAEAEASKELESENRRVLEEIENEQISNELTAVIEAGNPFIADSNKNLLFSYAHPNTPKLLSGYGMTKPRIMKMPDDPNGPLAEPSCRLTSRSSLHASLRVLKRLAAPAGTTSENPFDGIFPHFTVTMEMRLPIPPIGDSKILTLKHLKNTGVPLDLVRWPLRIYRFNGYNSLTGVIPFEAELYGVTTDHSGMSKKENQDVMHVFNEPRPPRSKDDAAKAFVATVKAPDFCEVDDKKTSNVIDGVTYEWMHLVRPHVGWVVKEKSNRPLWAQMYASATLTDEGVIVSHVNQKDVNENVMPYRVQGTATDGELDEADTEEAKEKKEDQNQNTEITLSSDVHDLLEAIRIAKKLKAGDKVARNPNNWERQNEDGGAGSIGRVLRVDDDEVSVQWPSGNKCSYSWGRNGRYEIVKVADGDEDDDGRETLNNDAHLPELRKGGQACGQCGAQKLEVGNWYRCNHCEVFSLCKACFKKNHHDEHDFTDMAALAGQAKTDEICPGAWVKIKMTVTNPKHGWRNAKAGDIGLVTEYDPDTTTLTIELHKDNTEIFMDMAEVEKADAPEDAEKSEQDEQTGFLAYLIGVYQNNQKSKAPGAAAAAVAKAAEGAAVASAEDAPKKTFAFLNAMAEIANTRANGKFKIGEWVRDTQAITGEIKAYNPQTRVYSYMNNNGYGLRQKTEGELRALGCKIGDTARILTRRPGEKNFTGALDNFRDAGGTSTKVGAPFRGLSYYVRFPSGTTEAVQEKDIQPIGLGKWFFTKDAEPGLGATPVPTSSNITIERNFIDGVPRIDVFIRDNTYTVDLEVGNVLLGETPVGKLRREPEVAFIRGEEKKAIDDGHLHVISLIFQNGDATALCDGVPLSVSLTGPISALPEKDADNAELNPRRFWLSRALALDSRVPLSLLGCSMQDTDFRGSNFRGAGFPIRYCNWLSIDVEQRTDPLDWCVKWHQVIDTDTAWECINCSEKISRLKDACTKCSMPRINKKSKEELKKYLFSAALPGSKEASSVRLWLHSRLRAQYQKELDGIDEQAAATEAAGGTARRRRRGAGGKNDDDDKK